MKTQEQLNQDYDEIMINFKQKAFINCALQHEEKLEEFVSSVYNHFSNHFNNEYKHIYLKPLNELSLTNIYNSEIKQSFFAVAKQLPSTFWNTPTGQEVVINQAKLSIHCVFSLPITEDRQALFTAESSENIHPVKELSKTDKIRIQENFSDFTDSFINSTILPECLRHKCIEIMWNELKNLSYNTPPPFIVDFAKDSDFVREVLGSVKFHNPFERLTEEKFGDHLFNSSKKLCP